jgi:hypothetical protein
MKTTTNLITGIAIGTGLMFLLDPQHGNRRRALVRDKAKRWSKETGRALEKTGDALEQGYRQVAAGSRGAVEAVKRITGRAETATDRELEARLQSCIGRHSTHPSAIDVSVTNGRATIRGPILAAEAREVLECASAIGGVVAVENRLEVHADPGDVPALQGGTHRRGMMRWWERSPTLRVATSSLAAAVLVAAAARKMIS